jgi:hypothetical protein
MMSQSIIFHLDEHLKVYKLGGNVKEGGFSLSLLKELKRSNRTLELTDRFEGFWKGLDERGFFDFVDKIYFWLGPRAGFTDTRVVYIWLKSLQMFGVEESAVRLNIFKLSDQIDLEHLEVSEIVRLTKISEKNESLSYAAEPRIG